MISIYTSAFNVIKNQFDYIGAIDNFTKIADETVVAINTSQDLSYNAFEKLFEANDEARQKDPTIGHIKILKTNFSYKDPDLDGKVKNAALQHCKHDICLGIDLDERININQKSIFETYAKHLKNESPYGCTMLPVINLYGDLKHYTDINNKWYLHKREGVFRGTFAGAKNKDGTHDISKSDSCELINKNGCLIPSWSPLSGIENEEIKLRILQEDDVPFIVHLGYLNLNQRATRNKNFWKNHWQVECGREVEDIPTSIENFKPQNIKLHNITFSF